MTQPHIFPHISPFLISFHIITHQFRIGWLNLTSPHISSHCLSFFSYHFIIRWPLTRLSARLSLAISHIRVAIRLAQLSRSHTYHILTFYHFINKWPPTRLSARLSLAISHIRVAICPAQFSRSHTYHILTSHPFPFSITTLHISHHNSEHISQHI